MTEKGRSEYRVDQQPAFVLHTYPWRETSLIVEFFTRDYGRIPLVARGAKRPMSQYRGLLNPFCPLAVSYSGKGEVKNLTRCEWYGTIPMNEKVLMSAFYINELLVRLLPRGEPEPSLFTIYYDTLKKLALEKDYLVPLDKARGMLDKISNDFGLTDFSRKLSIALESDKYTKIIKQVDGKNVE